MNVPNTLMMNVPDTLLNNLDESIFILDNQGKILLFNAVADKLNKDLLIKPFYVGEYLADAMDLETGLQIRDIIEEIKLKKVPEKSYVEFTSKNCTKVLLEFSFVPVINDEGVETCLQLIVRDITAQKIFEKKINNQVANTANLVDNANAIIIGIDTGSYITDWNKHCTNITGFEKSEAYAQKLTNLLSSGGERLVLDEFIRRGLDGESIGNCEILINTKDGIPRIFLLSGTTRVTPTGDVIGLIFVGQDVTELTEYRKSLEKKVEERTYELQCALNKEKEVVEMKNRFVSIASHEFRSPLSSIEFETDIIQQTKRIDRKILNIRLESIKKKISHMNRLLDDVLTHEKSETGKIQLITSDILLLEFLNRITEEVSRNRNENHIIKTEYLKIPEIIRADEKLLRSILINLLTNAIKFSPGKEQVYSIVKRIDDQISIIVRDEGIGIPADELNKIFEPFIRGKGVGAIQGTGLGLSIVKKSVELLNGIIRVESELNKGTTFTVTIPINQ